MNNLTKGTFAVLLLSSAVASADQQYPAADFQPEVLYQNSDYIAKETPKAAPAKAAAPVAKAAAVEVDSKYPAADFQPEVLYHDPNYKPSTSAKSVSVKEKAVQTSNAVETAPVAVAKEESSSSTTYLVGLLGLALAGFYLFNKSKATATNKTTSAPATKSYAVNTGVAKYLQKITGTGVERYINSQEKVSTTTQLTGVAKYVANQPEQGSAKVATGVDKYVRNRG